jgi:hypothetical protein
VDLEPIVHCARAMPTTSALSPTSVVLALVLGSAVGCVTEPDTATVATEDTQETWWNRAICDTVRCEDPAAAAAACEAEWGENNTAGRTYNIFASCTGSWTNSDCYSDCFRNYCQCGSTAGTPGACTEVESDEEWPECSCGHSTGSDSSEDDKSGSSESSSSGGIVEHRYWCCSDRCGTIHGWSDTDYCGC